jgi:formylglycine-generating enzyme required for sulfatase activity
MPRTTPHPALTLPALLASLFLATGAWAADYTSLVGQARELLQEDRIVEALAVAKDAVRANTNDYKGHYYVALAYLGMARFDEADEAAKRARALAPDSARAGVDKLVASIQSRRQGVGSVQAAEAALADGLAGKAARLYEAAWSAGRDNPELGLKAADLYTNRLNQPVDAGRVLRQVMQSAKGSPAADRATGELRKLADALKKIAQGHVAAAAKQQGEDARESLLRAEEADPGYLPLYQTRARIAAQGSNADALQAAIKDLARRDAASPKALSNLPGMAQWLRQPAFAEFVTDLLGEAQVRTLVRMARNPTPEGGTVIQDCSVCPEMVVIEEGNFEMGSNEYDSEKPVHTVNVPAFALARTEVTFAQWEACVADGGCSGYQPKDEGWGRGERPVINVSWNDAQNYVRWLSRKTGHTYRLPSEAEWEYAARAGTTTKYWWGDQASHEYMNYGKDECCDGWASGRDRWEKTAPVGQFPASAFGLLDMNGNVWEWVEDCWNASYSGAPSNGSAWTSGDCGKRVLRGGSWGSGPRGARAAYRVGGDSSNRLSGDGFRPARVISP